MRGLSGYGNKTALLAAVCLLLSAGLLRDLYRQTTLRRADGSNPADARVPSARCAKREEWQGVCRLWSGKPHHRYLAINEMNSDEGIGASLTRVAGSMRRAISFDLEPVINGPLLATHDVGDFGDWMGLTHNPLLTVQDPVGLENATNESVPFPEGNSDDWFREQTDRTSVVYTPDAMKVEKMLGWGKPVSPPNPNAGVCRYVREALRTIFWSVPEKRRRCHGLLPEEHHIPQEGVVSNATASPQERKRPWVVAVHVRRGDTILYKNGERSLSHTYFQATVASILRAISAADPAAHVSILVFSEGPESLTGLHLLDEHGEAVEWDIEQESCLGMGLICRQRVYLQTSAFESFDCMAAADVVVASRSTFSQGAAAVSTNVKVMLLVGQTEQDRVTLDPKPAEKSGSVTFKEQSKMNTAIADWWYCYGEARRLVGSTAERAAAHRFYQTVDDNHPSF